MLFRSAIALAVSPVDGNHLLLATDSGLLRSRNGGLEWTVEAPSVLVGAVFAVAFDADGRRALASTGSAIFRSEDDRSWESWHRAATPPEAAPARVLVAGARGRAYLAGWRRVYRTEDGGASWSDAAAGLPDEPVAALAVVPGPAEILYAVVAGRAWTSADAGRTWQERGTGLQIGRASCRERV